MGNDGGMRALGRRGAIVVTSAALVFAAAGTTVAAIRATGYEGAVAPSGTALRPPRSTPGPTLPPTASDVFVPDVEVSAGGSTDPAGNLGGAAGATASSPDPGGGSSAEGTGSGSTGGPAAAAATGAPGATASRPLVPTVVTLPPASGPTPTTSPVRPASTATCPGNVRRGALPPRGGPLQAVDFALPWPVPGPLVLLPQASAARPDQAPIRITASTPHLLTDGLSLTLNSPLGVSYTLESGAEKAKGSIRFTSVSGPTLSFTKQACRGSSFVLHDVNKATLHGSALRIIGVVAPGGTVHISSDGGTASFLSAAPGAHRVTLLTANDAGVAGDVIAFSVIVT
jgi:hypothetical protein